MLDYQKKMNEKCINMEGKATLEKSMRIKTAKIAMKLNGQTRGNYTQRNE